MTVLGGFIIIHVLLWLGRSFLPGFPGELCGRIQGLSITPFVMEFFMIAFGFMVVLSINHFRQKWDGDELVYLEVVDDPNAELPKNSQAVVFKDRAENTDSLDVSVAALEGAMELKDVATAKEILSKLSPQQLDSPRVRSIVDKLPS